MEQLKRFYADFIAKFSGSWGKLSLQARLGIGAVALLLIVGAGSALLMNREDPYEYVFVDLQPEDSQAVVSYLKRVGNTDFVVDSKGIKVPTKDVAGTRLKLAQEGLPAHGVVGWEKFDTQDFARTDFEQNVNKMRAIQGELSRTIMMIEGVTQAKVHIVTPKKSLFLEDKLDPTAAVYLKTRPGTELDKKQIKGIVNLVSRSV